MRNISELRAGDQVFIDANILVYHFGKLSSECKTLLLRCSDKEIFGYTSTSVIAEVLHRRMIAEAIEQGAITAKNPVQQLKKHPEIIRQLTQYNKDIGEIAHMNINILPMTQKALETSAMIRNADGLLTNDSLVAAVMQDVGLTKLATHDADFDRISWLHIYSPSDI